MGKKIISWSVPQIRLRDRGFTEKNQEIGNKNKLQKLYSFLSNCSLMDPIQFQIASA